MDINDETNPATLNGKALTFSIVVTEVEDDINDVTYPGQGSLNDVLSTNSFTNKTIDINTASFTMTNTQVNDRDLVLGNGVETVIYKGKITTGDADSVEINDFDLVEANATNLPEDLDKVISEATLNIGGQTFDGDIDADSVDFSSVNAVIPAGSDNVEVLVTAILKDNSAVVNGNSIVLQTSITGSDLEDSDSNDVSNVTIDAPTVNPVVTNLLDRGTLSIMVINEADTDDNLENTVLAGEADVTIAELEIEAEYEDMKIEDLTFSIAGPIDHSNTFKNVALVNAENGTVMADGAVVTFDGTNTLVTFTNDFTLYDADDLVEAELVAELNNITGTGDETTAQAGVLVVSAVAPLATDVRGVSSSDDITADLTGTVASEGVSIVPTKLTFAVVETLSNGSAKVQIVADSGGNTVGTSNEKPEVTLTDLTFAELGNNTDGYRLYKEGSASAQSTVVVPTAGEVVFDATALAGVDVTFDTEQTYVIVPTGTVDTTYTLVLSGDVATYDVDTTPVTVGVVTNLSTDLSV